MANIDDCIICFEPIGSTNITYANCIHGNHIHAKCILDWGKNTCPCCRSVIYDNNHTKTIIQDKIDYNLRH